jgi:hypothetical protein
MTDVAAEAAPAEGASPEGQQSAEQPVVKPASEPAKPSVKVISPEVEAQKVRSREDRPTLPGLVNDRNDVLDDVLLPRDPRTGKFMSREQAEALSERELLGLDEPEPAPKQKTSAPPLPTSDAPVSSDGKTAFEIAGEKYASREAFEQKYKSLTGQYKSFEANRTKLIQERDFGYETGWKWKAEYDKEVEKRQALEARLAGQAPVAGQPGSQPNGAQQSGGQINPSTADALNVDQILTDDVGAEFERLAINQGLPHAGKFLVQSTLKMVMEKVVPALRSEQERKLQPFQQAASDQQAFEGVQQTIHEVAAMRSPSGGVAFPEVHDSQKIAAIAQMWVDSGHPRETAFTTHGLLAAIGLYRLMTGFNPQPSASNQQPTTSQPNANASAPAATLDTSGEHNAPPHAGKIDFSLSPGARALVSALRMDEPMVDPILGFARNRKR